MYCKYWTMVTASIGILLMIALWLTQHPKNEWLRELNQKTAGQKRGQLHALDKIGMPLILEWEKIEANDPEFLAKMNPVSNIFIQAHTPITVDLLRKHPEVVNTIDDFKQLRPLFNQGIDKIDWKILEENLKTGSLQFFKHNIASLGPQDLAWLVVAKDGKEVIGYVLFVITPAFAQGTLKINHLMILPIAQHRGIGKLLASSVFNILSSVNIKRIILRTFTTNEQAIAAYTSYGFKQYQDKTQEKPSSWDAYKILFEYQINQSD